MVDEGLPLQYDGLILVVLQVHVRGGLLYLQGVICEVDALGVPDWLLFGGFLIIHIIFIMDMLSAPRWHYSRVSS